MTVTKVKEKWQQIEPSKKKWIKGTLGLLIGAGLGYSYYATMGCSTGSCSITSDPYVSTAWGALIGGGLSL